MRKKINFRHWNRLPKKVVELLPLEVFKRPVDIVLREMVDSALLS